MEQFEHFESYLSGKLSDADQKTFEKKLAEDIDFNSDFEMHQKMQGAMDILVEEDAKKFISSLDKAQVSSETKTTKKSQWPIYIAVLLLLLVGLFLFLNPFSAKEEDYMKAYLPPLAEATRSTDNTSSESTYYLKTEEAHKLIAHKKYEKAAGILEGLLPEFIGKEKQEIEWYLALIYSTYDLERSRLLLYNISTDQGHPYARKAKGLLD